MHTDVLNAYKGNQPYIFVSYSHADWERVFPLLKVLQDIGYRIWFDRGIEVGTEWSNNIAEHLSGCSAFLFFATGNSVKSENCLDEIAYAKSHKKPVLLAYLEGDVVLPSGMEMQTARFQRVYINRQESVSGFADSFSAAAMFDICRGESSEETKKVPIVKAKKPFNKAIAFWAVGVLAVIVVAVVVTLLSLEKASQPSKNGQEEVPDVEVAETVELSDALSEHTFRLNGVVYKLPVKFSELNEEGWVIGSSNGSGVYIGGHAKEYVTLVNDGKKIEVTFYNDSEYAKMLKDCLVGEISIYQMDDIDFCIAGGLTPYSTAAEMIEAYGTPTTVDEYTDYAVYKWTFGDYSETTARVYSDDMSENSAIELKNYVLSTESVKTSEDAPKYLNYYTAPSDLSGELLSGNISIDGKVYTLPAPLEEFLDDGWKISSGATSVISGASSDYTLMKGEKTLWINVKNYSKEKIVPKYCLVKRVSIEKNDGPEVILPGNIVFGLSLEELKAIAPEGAEVSSSSYSTSYYYSDYEKRNLYLSISVNNETDELDEIYLSNEIYDQLLD